ncbi:MAG: ABC transporter permease, partial [Pseudonocardiaceae bacterium]
QRLATDLGIPVQRLPVMNVFGVLLRHGAADWKAFAAAAQAAGHGTVNLQAGDIVGIDTAARSAQRGVRLEVWALVLFGVLAALVTLLLVGQTVTRQILLQDEDYAVLCSLGATRAQLVGSALVQPAMIAAAGSVLAFAVAALASPLMPLGLARQAEIHPGFEVNLAILLPGIAGLSALVAAWALLPAWRVSRQLGASAADGRFADRPSRIATARARSSAPPASIVGVRFGLERGRGRTAVPVATAMVGAIASVAALTGALTFGTSLTHLLNTPREQGWNWDVLVGNPNDSLDREAQGGALLAHNPLVGSYSAAAILGAVKIDQVNVPSVLAIDPLKGSVHPPLLDGRAPRAPDEIALGTRTLHQLHRHLGDTVHLETPDGTALSLRIVGRMVAPSIGDLLTNGVGEGGWVAGSLVHQQWASPSNQTGTPPPGTDVFNLFAVRHAPGVSQRAAFASLQRAFGSTVLRRLPSEDAVNLQSVEGLPFVLAGLVGLLGVATVGNTLVASVRRRRRDLAILKAVGFVRRQVASTVAWQATSFAVVAVVVGLPLGVAGGRWAWSLVASAIGSVSPPVVSVLATALAAPVTLVLANAIAAWPGWTAGRVAPAVAMRSE